MASIKRTFYTLLTLVILLLVVAGGVYGWQWWQTRQVNTMLTQAHALLGEGKPLEANRLLEGRLMQAKPSDRWAAEAITLQLTALHRAGDQAAEEALARKALNPQAPWVQPGQEGWARAELAIGDAAIDAGQADPARQAYEAILNQQGGSAYGRNEAQFGLARIKLADPNAFNEGYQELSALMERLPEGDPLVPRVQKLLGVLNIKRLMDRQPHGDDQIYVIQRGDTIDGMSRKFKVSKDVLMTVNGITDPRTLTIGRRLKIPDLDFSIIVNKADNTLTLKNHGKFFKLYHVRTGEADYMTPTGNYTIGRKVENPPWTDPKTRETYGPGAPGNELGVRWMGFAENPSIGIHQAVDANTVGTYGSNGCVGLAHDDIIELYNLVRVGTPVQIVGQRAPTAALSTLGGAGQTGRSPASTSATPAPAAGAATTPKP